jgi:YidC/Oxa1 family membrane protein insertase
MAAPTKSLVRILVPLAILAAVGLLIAWPIISGNTAGTQGTQPPAGQSRPAEQPATPQAERQPGPGQATVEDDLPPPAAETPQDAPDATTQAPAEAPEYRVLPVAAQTYARIGGVDPDKYALEISFTVLGAGIERIQLAGYKQRLGSADPVPVQEIHSLQLASGITKRIVPFAATAVEINGVSVPIYIAYDEQGVGQPAWSQVEPGRFQATIADADGTPVARLERHYQADGTSHDFTFTQTAENLTDRPMEIRWITFGPSQLYKESQGYGGDVRRVRIGYVEPGSPHYVVGGDFLKSISGVSGPRNKQTQQYLPTLELWPTPRAQQDNLELAWAGLTNRYFGVAVHGVAQGAPTPGVAPLLKPVERVSRVLLDPGVKTSDPNYVLGLEFTSPEYELAAGQSSTHAMGIYSGPLARELISANPSAHAVMLRQLVQYTMGGPCAFCTFPWLAHILIWLLNIIHDYLTLDWALAIIVLVLIVRTVLHPVTKWSQIRVQRFSHQMQQMGPKQKKIQEKFKGDPKRMQAEMAKLWREEGINPAGMLGCLPMFLQTPVWIALWASLYFAIELRHEPAFFGVFQMIGGWPFLADLSQPDAAITLPASVQFNLPLMGLVTSINLLPLLLGIVFFIQQKYMMPPPSATMTPEQQSQQKMMKVMMVVMFPIFMYNAPSGLALYFIANSTLGIVEMRYIRAHINKNDLLTAKQRDPSTKTFMQRLIERAQQRQEMIQAARGQGPAKGPTSGALGARRKKTENRRKGRR